MDIIQGNDPGDEQQTQHLVDNEDEFNEAMKNAPESPMPGPEELGGPDDHEPLKNPPAGPWTKNHADISFGLIQRVISLLSGENKLVGYQIDSDWANFSIESIKVECGPIQIDIRVRTPNAD